MHRRCRIADYVGPTDHVIRTLQRGVPDTRRPVGTELNLVNRQANEPLLEAKVIPFMVPTACMGSTMARIDPQHLAWTLENPMERNMSAGLRRRRARRSWRGAVLDRRLQVI